MSIDIIQTAQQVIGRGVNVVKLLPELIVMIIERRAWEGRKDRQGEPFESFQAFVEHPLIEGMETSIDDLLKYCWKNEDAQRLILGEVPEAGKHGGNGSNQYTKKDSKACNTQLAKAESQTVTKHLARLKRDRPDLAAKVVAGELSANKAAIEAGFRKPPTAIYSDPERWMAKLERDLGDELVPTLRLLIEELTDKEITKLCEGLD